MRRYREEHRWRRRPPGPVSYTHLDVYKRQVLGCAPGLPAACICSWMAEAILLALEGRYDRYFLGRELHAEKVAGIGRLAGRHGFALSGFTAAGHYFDFADLENIRANPPVIS